MRIETERLVLRELEAADLPHMQRYGQRPEFFRFLPIDAQTADTIAAFLDLRLAEINDPDRVDFDDDRKKGPSFDELLKRKLQKKAMMPKRRPNRSQPLLGLEAESEPTPRPIRNAIAKLITASSTVAGSA